MRNMRNQQIIIAKDIFKNVFKIWVKETDALFEITGYT